MFRCLAIALLLLSPLEVVGQDPIEERIEAQATQPVEAAAPPEAAAEPAQEKVVEETTGQENEEEPGFKPRYELYVPSVGHFVRRAAESHAGALARHASGLFFVRAAGGEGLTTDDWRRLGEMIRKWPDTSLGVATYAPTTEGKARWVIRLSWPLADLRDRVREVLDMDALEEVLEGVVLTGEGDGSYKLVLGETTLAVLAGDRKGRGLILSDTDVPRAASLYGQDAERTAPLKDSATLVYSRFNLAGTEKDSGALFGVSVPWVQSIRYQASVRSGGQWSERFGVTWNVLVGTTAKAAVRQAKRGFCIPREAFGAIMFSSPMLKGMLDVMSGLPPGTLVGQMGGLSGERVGPETCLVLLPGTGILPFPDLVIQTRLRYASAVLDDVRQAITKANQERANDDLVETWHEIEVDGRTVFYDDGRGAVRAGMQPVVYRKVIFADRRKDPKGRMRSFLNIAFTSTEVAGMVRRWTAPLSGDSGVALGAGKKFDGQGWLNWRKLYEQLHLWLNLAIAGLDPLAVLPPTEAVAEHLPDARVTVKAKFTGLLIRHRGPVPLGTLYLPLSLSSTLAPDESGSTDLSRERIACERLKLLYKNAKLFKKDVGRWPARVAELDGYIDFAGNPWVLRLRQSTRSAWRQGLADLLGSGQGDTEEEDQEADIDDSIYLITWDGSRWTLGVKSGILDHLADLHIDQEGRIHRRTKSDSDQAAEQDAPAEKEQKS